MTLDWSRELLGAVFVASLILSIGGIALVPVLVARMAPDYFVRRGQPPEGFRARHPVIGAAVWTLRNLAGGLLLTAGLAMLVLPGQGLLTILVALSLLSFPGKRRLERAIARQRHVRRALAWLRRRAGKPPLQLD